MIDRGLLPSYPVDGLGVPLPVHPRLPVGSPPNPVHNLHHNFYYSDNPFLNTPAGAALRYSRVQRVPMDTHGRLHDAFGGPLLPITAEQTFGIICLNLAHYVPARAINFATAIPEEVDLFPERRSQIRDEIGTEAELRPKTTKAAEAISNYLIDMLMTNFQKTDPDADDQIDFIANTLKDSKRDRTSRNIVRSALPILSEPVQPMYKSARRKGGIASNQPQHVSDVVLASIVPKGEILAVAPFVVSWCETTVAIKEKQKRAGNR